MKKLNNTILVSSTPPSDKNSMWYDGKSLYVNNKGIWEPVTSTGGGTPGGGGASSEFMVNINYDDLVVLRDTGKLVPGCKYRIIDYETTTSAAGTTCTFDKVNQCIFYGFCEFVELLDCSNISASTLQYTNLHNINSGATMFSRIDGKKDSIIRIDGNNFTDNLCIYQDKADNVHIVETASIFKTE